MQQSGPRGATRPGFSRVRRDHATETAEDYVEAIAQIAAAQSCCRGADLARHFEVSHVTVSKILTRLKSEGLVHAQPYGPVELTAKGRRLAAMSHDRHALVLEFLLALGVDEVNAQADAEGIEHHVSEATLARFRAWLAARSASDSSPDRGGRS